MPAELPMHPAFHKGLRPTKRSNFSPLGDIGAHRRKHSGDNTQSMMYAPVTASIDETIRSAAEPDIIVVEEPPLLPELQHLTMVPPPPPPPPPAPFTHRHDPESSSLSSSSGVGVIQMVLHDEPGDEINVVGNSALHHYTQGMLDPRQSKMQSIYPGQCESIKLESPEGSQREFQEWHQFQRHHRSLEELQS